MDDDQTLRFSLRLPKELHDRITISANRENRSMNAEMLYLLDRGLSQTKPTKPAKDLLAQLLPPNLLWRVERFQKATALSSSEEAAKRLIKSALDEKESTIDILDKLADSFKDEKDLRILARDVIAAHAAVKKIDYGDDYVWFLGRNGESGAIDKKGKLFYSDEGHLWEYDMGYYKPRATPPKEIYPTDNYSTFGTIKNPLDKEKFSSIPNTDWDSPDDILDLDIPF